ncbi:MAG: hypothetical protein SGILL_010102 [Bacillariaceae sp.]
MNRGTLEEEQRVPLFEEKDQLAKTVEAGEAGIEVAPTALQEMWDAAKGEVKLSRYERTEAVQDVEGKNILAMLAPKSLSKLGIEALDRELRRREREQRSADALVLSAAASSPMFQDRDFRLAFARADRYDPCKAASRIVAYLSNAVQLFGQYAINRPTKLTSDFEADVEKAMRMGWMQLLLTRDRIGRRILVLDDLGPEDVSIQNKDTDSQNLGVQLVIQVFNPEKSLLLKDPATREHFRRLFACSPVRFSCIHFCFPALSFSPNVESKGVASLKAPPLCCNYNAFTQSAASLLGRDERVRTKLHTGSIIECHEKLGEYGINPDSIPMTSTGRVKLRDHEKWIMIQLGRERTQQQGQRFPIVECPVGKHILLVKGRRIARHEGNMRLRSMLQERYQERNEASRAQKIAITTEVMDNLTGEGYVFLVKNSGEFWVVPDRKTVMEKLAIAFRTVPRLKPLDS